MSDIDAKRAEIRAFMRLAGVEKSGANRVLDALLEATLKQQEGTALGSVNVEEAALLDFLDLLSTETTMERRVIARGLGERLAEPLFQAYEEIVRDEKVLLDVEQVGYVGAAVYADLTRDATGSFAINVALKDIDGAQLAFVLGIARRYELEAREEERYLTLRAHLAEVDVTDEEREPEAVEA